jgi:hypothetical protein
MVGGDCSLDSMAALLHFAWNNIESLVVLAVLWLSEMAIGLAAFLVSLQIELKRRFGASRQKRAA